MECLFPIEGYRQPDGTVRLTGELTDRGHILKAGHDLVVPCGRCSGCRVERSRQWAVRMMHEAQMHSDSSFITLTYDAKHLPADLSLDVRHVVLFFKRLRKRLPQPVSYFHCGEYGERHGRPHYHAALFGHAFRQDAESLPASQKGFKQWQSPLLTEAWGRGRAAVMELTFESAQYVAGYITSKYTGPDQAAHYQGRKPEYSTMSKRPAIGKRWYEKFKDDVYPRDEVVIRGHVGKPPKYYDQLLERENPELLEQMRERRKERAERTRLDDQTRKRREARAEAAEYRARRYAREIDSE